jgi:hypothetical protein
MGACTLACVALLAAILFVEFLQNRPIDLRGHSAYLAGFIEETLHGRYVPESGIRRVPEELRQQDRKQWYFYRFEIATPPQFNPEGLQDVVTTPLLDQGLTVTDLPAEGAVRSLSVSYQGCEIAVLAFVPTAARAAPEAARAAEPVPTTVPGLASETAPLEPAPVEPPPATEEGAPEGMAQLPALEDLPLESAEHPAPENGQSRAPSPAPQRPRIAIILDDGGYGDPDMEPALALDSRLTLSILPNTPFAGETAAKAAAKGFEVMLHMPLETHRKNGRKRFPGELRAAMNPEEIRQGFLDALAQVPGATGVNNHTGGLFTANSDAVKTLLEAVKENNLYFVDSRTVADSKAYDQAMALGLRSAARNVFLDNDRDPAKIRVQLEELLDKAKAKGQAIGIGHFRSSTVAVLAEDLPKLKDQGIDLVHVSELLP